MEEMNIFGSVEHNDDNSDKWPDLCNNPTNQDILDYMVMVLARHFSCDKAFKGGYMLNQILKQDSRMTRDIDFSIAEASDYSNVKGILIRIGEYFKSRGLVTSYVVKDTITPTSSGGITMYNSQDEVVVGADVGLHNIRYGVTQYRINIGSVKAFTIERMLADKILAILSRKRFRRTKDFYDFYVLITRFDFSYEELIYCIENRDNYDDSVWYNIPFSEEVIREYRKAWDKLRLISYQAGTDLVKPDFFEALEYFNIIAFRIKSRTYATSWDHTVLYWRVD